MRNRPTTRHAIVSCVLLLGGGLVASAAEPAPAGSEGREWSIPVVQPDTEAMSRANQPGMVLVYPEPTIFSKHILVPFSEAGEKLGEALMTDPDLRRLAIEHGFRNDEISYFKEYTDTHKLALPDAIVNVVEPPSYEVLEGMIQSIELKYQ